ncbi:MULTISPECIES: acyl-CoA dehydrogenase family protein [Gordonia]|jgi:alkylation response protein AidB-like acyl-CoA dehydrogenase|uniref:Acyl-CoA dehydrogenase n=3 Tax=Gordonia alkanivorans TaxID=84096 RepID=W9DFD1_9ACTN|nr:MULTISPECIES: acyl-CoA dehydrogenase family protein [Gordonia]ETA08243.1 acyl-CoA dehydrogenase [Gordonia alkanivorans CGMCC 6845]MDH3021735.1 acyl-CoA dehydrogenase family protein [Gordonia alkanivorans]MDH3025601.1 acyl-CoA dehydrogenase family protein [Gordonia alkanivorans]MDH3047500.1 acyl-CoA dehydrogenase family protein [Gordonia alkanivorans]MDJ0009406.1 acyl-CoA dehydrogenase family protein [Gordonia alkanivorans]
MAINLELPKKFDSTVERTHLAAEHIFRPISRKYDKAEHEYPTELDDLAKLAKQGRGSEKAADSSSSDDGPSVNGANMRGLISALEMSWGDVGLLLSIPGQGLGNAAIAAVANPEQLEKFSDVWAAMAITEPSFGSDSAAVSTTATRDGDDYLINGEKIFVTAGSRADHVVVWATIDKSVGRAAIKSFVVPMTTEGVTVARLEHKLGIKASDTAVIRFENARVPAENLLGSPEIDTKKAFGGVMQTFDNTRPVVAAMAIGLGRAALEELRRMLDEAGHEIDYDRPAAAQHATVAEFIRLESEWEASWLHTLRAAWMADNAQPNSTEASMSKAKAGRTVTEITNKAVEIGATAGFSETSLLEKWARDSKILDIFEGTQQIQQLIIARRVLGKSSTDLK